jgi:putative aldouronate transport system permease protein
MEKAALQTSTNVLSPKSKVRRKTSLLATLNKYKWYYVMMLPGLIYYAVFHYLPMGGLLIAFKDYNISSGIWNSPWIGFDNFITIFHMPDFYRLLQNTLTISFYRIIFGMLPDVVLALILNEIRLAWFKRTIQTITYGPHFLSWVIVYGLVFAFLATDAGLINNLLVSWGIEPISFLTEKDYFRSILVGSDLWKNTGFGAIIYLAALSTINPQLYEAAAMDGAGRWRQMWHITLPGIRNVFILLLILRIGQFMDAGFEQVYIFLNARVYETGDIIDTWVFRRGLEELDFSIATTVGFFKSLVGFVLILGANKLARKFGNGIW